MHMPTLAESQLLKRIAELEAEVQSLKTAAADDRKRRRRLSTENSTLRAKTGVAKRNSKKSSCIDEYQPGMTGSQLAVAAKCSVRYANMVIKLMTS